ncbi:short chain dehydrogenase [Mycobacterium sp. NAZ190054]|uniref:short chain dehydrogenase n=1 Tax=Mycobacterium sp. NAZ190054 TaxID=1747766 RepID=UPI000796479B|nr:short chain dehydrogenase [Mycobacterium sp. NAZ190054]KWX64512.1 short-chain dehydrogenase [Mycobacterium sp. NAZ190054]
MRVLVVGARGTVGSAVVKALRDHHSVIEASRNSEIAVDITDEESIRAMYATVGTVDAVVCAAGGAPFVALPEASAADFAAGFANKLGGQINLVLHGIDHLSDGGSFTLITGVLAREPVAAGAISSTVNGGLEAFVAAAAAELPRGIRINAVSPSVLTESLDKYAKVFPGFADVPAADVARAFVKSVEGIHTGRVYPLG